MSYTKELDYVPFFRQEPGDYCGPANAQMARDGYPDSSNRVKYCQEALFNIIKAHNSTAARDAGKWNTDPQGLRECLQSLSSAPVDWEECSSTDPDEVMQFILKSIHNTGFPIPAVVQQGDHWVLIVGWETDVEPSGANKPKLLHIHILDPQHKSPAHSYITAKTWRSANHFRAIDMAGTWAGKYVAVGQGPL